MKKEVSFQDFSERLFEKIDISPTQYKAAISHYEAVSNCLVDGQVGSEIYVQGSFALGTVVRPFKGGKDADYDLDIVCQGAEAKTSIEPRQLKMRVKVCLEISPHHRDLLCDEEGRRCWRLDYAPSDGGVGFHMDILPCVMEEPAIINDIKEAGINPQYANSAIAITDKKNKETGIYGWSCGNPRGYAKWFYDINEPYLLPIATAQKTALVEKRVYASIADVPTTLLRSPVQRVIQLLKRHRDCRFDNRPNKEDKPISIIITTLVAQIAQRLSKYNATVYDLLQLTVSNLDQYASLMENDFEYRALLLPSDYFSRTREGWFIPNPVNPRENFANRWAENNNSKARAFFEWICWVKEDFNFDRQDSGAMFKNLQESFGEKTTSAIYRDLGLNPISTPVVFVAPSNNSAPKPYRR